MSNTNNIYLNRAFNSLQGLSVGDAFGEKFFLHIVGLIEVVKEFS